MKVGITIPGMHPLEGNSMLLQLAESMHADSLWAPDHILGVFHPELWSEMAYSSLAADPDAFYDPWVLGGALGQQTQIPFGPYMLAGAFVAIMAGGALADLYLDSVLG